MPDVDPSQRDDAVEAGALDERDDASADRPPERDEPVERGALDWLEVHELAEVVAGDLRGRQGDDDIVLFKSLGIAAEDLAVAKLVLDRARERGLGIDLAVSP